jgi:prepilin-type N-terminal cleavage/methylation domain-containing protein
MTKNAGFSLVEVMVAILILGIALVGLVQGVNTALVSSKESEVQTAAALLAAGQIETIRADAFGISDGETDGNCGDELSQYQWHQTITGTQVEGLHEVKVVVENSKTGKSVYELRTMLFEKPLVTEEDEKAKKDKEKKRERKKG